MTTITSNCKNCGKGIIYINNRWLHNGETRYTMYIFCDTIDKDIDKRDYTRKADPENEVREQRQS